MQACDLVPIAMGLRLEALRAAGALLSKKIEGRWWKPPKCSRCFDDFADRIGKKCYLTYRAICDRFLQTW